MSNDVFKHELRKTLLESGKAESEVDAYIKKLSQKSSSQKTYAEKRAKSLTAIEDALEVIDIKGLVFGRKGIRVTRAKAGKDKEQVKKFVAEFIDE